VLPAATRRPCVLESERASSGRGDGGDGHAVLDGGDDGPLPGALLARLVQDGVDQHLAGALGVLGVEDVRRDLDQEAVELALVPAANVGDLARRQPEALAQQRGRLGDQLHVAVLDAVVDHLDEVPGRAAAAVGRTGRTRCARRSP
jgi:hypothetical protein